MMEALRYYARCNKAINDKLVAAIEGATGMDCFGAPQLGFFHSIGDLLEHVYKSDIYWLDDIRKAKAFKTLGGSLLAALPDRETRLFSGIAAYKVRRAELDAVFIDLMEEMADGDLGLALRKVNRRAELMEKTLWKALFHVFNHQTHHRGMVSQLLDQMGVKNDYSNMVFLE